MARFNIPQHRLDEYRERYKKENGGVILWVLEILNPVGVRDKYMEYQRIFDNYKDNDGWIMWEKLSEDLVKEYKEFYHSTIVPDEQQLRFLLSMQNNPRTTVKSGKGCGKTTSISWFALWFCSVYQSEVFITGPKFDQLKVSVIKECNKWIQKSKFLQDYYEPLVESILPKDDVLARVSYIRIISASKAEGMQGLHAENICFLVDEASVLTEEFNIVINAIFTSLNEEANHNVRVVLSGNPIRTSGAHFDSFNRMKHRYECITFNGERSFNVSRDFIEDLAQTYGRNSNVYKMQVTGEFPDTSSDVVLEYAVAIACIDNEDCKKSETGIMGVDVAGAAGQDESVIAIRYGGELRYIFRYPNMEPHELARVVCSYAFEYNCTDVFIDAGGMGRPVFTYTVELVNQRKVKTLKPNIVEVNFGEKPFDTDRFNHNAKGCEMYFNIRDYCKQNWFSFNRETIGERDLTAVIDELTSRLTLTDDLGRLMLEKKKAYRDRKGKSPDLADAVALAYCGDFSGLIIGTIRKDKSKSYSPDGGFDDKIRLRDTSRRGWL